MYMINNLLVHCLLDYLTQLTYGIPIQFEGAGEDAVHCHHHTLGAGLSHLFL